ncbi:MAG: hypothetical protein QOF14_2109 [Hyphomicrobiales bacterium]|jgi:hypothetical protein|nr:hypothetical protein [Hyphomicrobiales bacterium]
MSETLTRIKSLVQRGDVSTSVHGFRELAADGILLDEVTGGVAAAIVVEEYAEAVKGPSVLVLQRDRDGKPLHVLWGIPKGANGPATIITAYRPKPDRWSGDFMRRK